jgi:hypothetical protein
LVESGENATIASTTNPGARHDQLFEGADRGVIQTSISTQLLQPIDRQAVDVVARLQPGLVHEPRDVVEGEAVGKSPLDEAQAIDMPPVESNLARTAGSSLRWLL